MSIQTMLRLKPTQPAKLKPGMIIDHWASGTYATSSGKRTRPGAVEKITCGGGWVNVEFSDGRIERVRPYALAFVRMPTREAQKELIMNLFDSQQTIGGQPYFPLGVISLRWKDALKELVTAGRVEIIEFGHDSILLVMKLE